MTNSDKNEGNLKFSTPNEQIVMVNCAVFPFILYMFSLALLTVCLNASEVILNVITDRSIITSNKKQFESLI